MVGAAVGMAAGTMVGAVAGAADGAGIIVVGATGTRAPAIEIIRQ
jgi:hypothetical protein